MFRVLWNRFVRLFSRNSSAAALPIYAARIASDEPEHIDPMTLYLVGEDGAYWLAVMVCPCGCGDTIRLPMSTGSSPCWRVGRPLNPPTLWPSVHRTVRCRSHFILRRGAIEWCVAE